MPTVIRATLITLLVTVAAPPVRAALEIAPVKDINTTPYPAGVGGPIAVGSRLSSAATTASTDSICLEATYSSAGVVQNTATSLKLRSE